MDRYENVMKLLFIPIFLRFVSGRGVILLYTVIICTHIISFRTLLSPLLHSTSLKVIYPV